jgi:hypothetical protein
MVEPYETGNNENRLDDNEKTTDQTDKKENQNKIRLYRIARQIHDNEDMFVDQYHAPYAFVKVKDHMEVLDVYSLRFQHWVYRKLVWYDNGRPMLPEPADVTRILDHLKAYAEFDAVRKILHLRVAAGNDDTSICYDLSNPFWQTIKIMSEGWLIEETPTVMFRRYNNQTAQVYPSREYDKDIFDKFVNLINVKNDDSKLLLKCYIIALLIPDIPKAILMLHGEPNSAKTTLLELIKMLIDPCSTRTLTCRKENDELAQLFSHNYLPYFDNLSYISDWVSDAFCRAATGDSFSKRKLYTDNDDIFYTFMRCIGFSGVNLAATKSDLLDRGLIIELERISSDSQRQIRQIWKDFDEMKPQLLGYLFDILSKVLNMRQTSHIDVKGLPRLADWAEVCELISRCLGYEDNQFIEAFGRNVKLQNEAAIEDSAIAQAIIHFMKERSHWNGTPTELLGLLEALAPSLSINTKNHKIWPSKPNVLSRRLKYVISNLKEFGINIRPGDNSTTKNKTLSIEKIVESSIPSIHRYDTQNDAQVSSDISIDKGNGINTSIDTPQISIPENLRIHAQNGSGIDGIDTIDILQDNCIETEPFPYPFPGEALRGKNSFNQNITMFSCKYCEFHNASRYDYDRHTVIRHPNKAGYPDRNGRTK